MAIIGYSRLNPDVFRRKRMRVSREGKPVKGRFDKPLEDDCPRSEVSRQPIIAWRTPKDLQEGMQTDERRVINAIKSFLVETQSALWYHNGNCDAMVRIWWASFSHHNAV